ncbi:hypothetical protein JTE90_003019 [Oedothorax gibbosus]|uniref:Nucleolar protein 11 n=1 Tax=Oedothorax gibbosus TaxID=931172 RepID=A0AAV6VBU3_9ARAC|nr:hypothetical protein JTE90_003019 [Oedothorax gibbosus]
MSLCDESCALLNDGTKSVVKLSDRKLLHSWTVTHPHSLTCPAVFDKNNGAIYCVMDSKVLLKWSLDDDELKLKTAKKAKFPENIFAVLPVHQQSPIVLFSCGKILKCENLESNNTPVGEAFIDKSEEILWADTVVHKSTVQFVCVGISKKNKVHTLHDFILKGDTVSGYHSQPLKKGNEKLVDFCLNRHTNSFYSVWSFGTILEHQLENHTQSSLLTIPETKNEILLCVDCIDANHIVLFKSNPNLKEAYLEIWDFKFEAVKARKQLKLWPVISPQISVLDSSIFLACDEALFEISYQVEKSSLAAAIGKSTTNTPNIPEFNWSKGKRTKVPDSDSIEKMETSDSKDIEILLTDPIEMYCKRLMDEGSDFLNYIPESDLVRLLRLALRHKFEKSGQFILSDIDPDIVLNAIFATTFTEAFLVQFMKKLSLEESLATLEALLSFLSHHNYNLNDLDKYPSDFQLFSWIFLVYQSHMEAMLLSKDSKCVKLIKRLDSCIQEKFKEYEEYDTIQNLFIILQNETNILPEKYMDGKYCIESLDI